MKFHFPSKLSVIAIVLSVYCAGANAGGFQLYEQDAADIGDSHSGVAAQANDAGTEYYNPAGMTNLKHLEISAGLAYIPLNITYSGTVGASPIVTPVSTVVSSNTNNFVPNFHVVYPLNHYVAFGFGVTVPFGLMTNYPLNNPISVAATKTQLRTVNVNPNIAFAPNKYISIGVGFDALYGEATYDSSLPMITPLAILHNYLNDWAYGWNIGGMIYFTPHIRIGASYRSEISLNGKGFSHNGSTDFTSNNLTGEINLPPTTIMSFYADINPKLSLMFSAYYTQWSVFNNLILNNVAASDPPIIVGIHENYKNTWNVALGLHYWIFKSLMLKVGVGHDQTPTQDGMRDVRLPDSNRYSLALGLHWETCRSVAVDLGWMHFFIKNAEVNNSNSTIQTLSPLGVLLAAVTQTVGSAKSSVNVVGIQVSWKMNT